MNEKNTGKYNGMRYQMHSNLSELKIYAEFSSCIEVNSKPG